jgi:hypothetical protein
MRESEDMTLWHAVTYSLMAYITHAAFIIELAKSVFYHVSLKLIKG